jgi:HEAT repeat protein
MYSARIPFLPLTPEGDMARKWIPLAMLLGAFLIWGQGRAGGQTCQGSLPADSRPAVSKAMKELMTPPYTGIHDNELVSDCKHYSRPKSYLACDYKKPCQEAIDFLIQTKIPVTKDLLQLAAVENRLRARYRAAYILVARGDPQVIPLLDKMCASTNGDERWVGWHTYQKAIAGGKLKAPTDIAKHLALYAKENDLEIREKIAEFLGAAKAKIAIRSLVEAVAGDGSCSAVWALGEIGDKRAVPTIIADFENLHRPYNLAALGKLATPEAVDYIILHLDTYGAVDGLCQTRSKKALPALTKHLAKLRLKKGDNDFELAATRVAIIRLSHKDPRQPLMKLAENPKENRHVHRDALEALRLYDSTPFQGRILQVYTKDKNEDVKRSCVRLLVSSKLEGVIEAMVDHALTSQEDSSLLRYLRVALNKRLGTSFRRMKLLRAHLRKLRQEQMPREK